MAHENPIKTHAWAFTDVYGQIQSCSRVTRALLQMSEHRPPNLLSLFPNHGKALVFDIEIALTGWPTGRTVWIRRAGARDTAVRYMVSRRVDSEGLQLFWELTLEEGEDLRRSA